MDKRKKLLLTLLWGLLIISGFTTINAANLIIDNKSYAEISTVTSKQAVSLSTTLQKPAFTIVEAGYTTMELNFCEDEAASGYEIYRATAKNGKFKLIASVNAKQFIDRGLTSNKTYYYKVRILAVEDSKKIYSSFSTIKSRKTLVLDKATLATKVVDFCSIELDFSTVADADGYMIYRATAKNGKYKHIATVSENKFVDTGAITNKTYFYKVRAYRVDDIMNGKELIVYGPYSSIKSNKAKFETPKIKIDETDHDSVKISWEVIEGAEGYEIARYDNVTKKWRIVKTVPAATMEYVNSNLVSGRQYQYKVRAFRVVNKKRVYSVYSLAQKTKPMLLEPTLNLQYSSISNAIASWREIPGAEGYLIYRRIPNFSSAWRNEAVIFLKNPKNGRSFEKINGIYYAHVGAEAGLEAEYKIVAFKTVNGKRIYGKESEIRRIAGLPKQPSIFIYFRSEAKDDTQVYIFPVNQFLLEDQDCSYSRVTAVIRNGDEVIGDEYSIYPNYNDYLVSFHLRVQTADYNAGNKISFEVRTLSYPDSSGLLFYSSEPTFFIPANIDLSGLEYDYTLIIHPDHTVIVPGNAVFFPR